MIQRTLGIIQKSNAGHFDAFAIKARNPPRLLAERFRSSGAECGLHAFKCVTKLRASHRSPKDFASLDALAKAATGALKSNPLQPSSLSYPAQSALYFLSPPPSSPPAAPPPAAAPAPAPEEPAIPASFKLLATSS